MILFVVLRKEGTTLDREQLCNDCYLPEDIFDSTLANIEAVFPDYRICVDFLSVIGYRELKEVRKEKKERSCRCIVV